MNDLEVQREFINEETGNIVESHSFDRSTRGSRSRSVSVETCIRNTVEPANSLILTENKEDMGKIEEVHENFNPNAISIKSTFSRGAIAGIFSSTPICTMIGFEIREAMGNKNGLLGALFGAAASAIVGGIISSIMLRLYPSEKQVNNKSQTEETDEPTEIIDEESNSEVKAQIPSTNNEEVAKKTAQKTELTEDDIEFIMDNTDFDRNQVIRWFGAFKAQCPDCKLDRSNFRKFYKNLIPGNSQVKDEFADAVFQAFDFDNNGYVDFGEFLIAFWIKAKGSVRNKLVWLFDVYDSDKSGYISMTELTHMLRLVFSLKNMNDDPLERAQYVMGLVDCNSDGQLSRLEFVEGCMKDDDLRELLET